MTDKREDLNQEEELDQELDNGLEEENNSTEDEERESLEEALEGDDEDVSDEDDDSSKESDPNLSKARSNGYLTKEEYVAKFGTDKGYKSPEEFNKFGDAYSEVRDLVKGLHKRIDRREKENESLIKYIDSIKKRERDQAKTNLQRAIQAAEEEGDTAAIRELSRREVELAQEEAQEQLQSTVAEQQQALEEFLERNKTWYNVDTEMTARANQLDQEIRAGKHTDKFPVPQNHRQLSAQIEVLIKEEYRDRVGGMDIPRDSRRSTPRPAPALSSAQSATVKSTTKDTSVDKTFRKLDKDQKNMYSALSRMMEKEGKTMTKAEFIQRLKDYGDL